MNPDRPRTLFWRDAAGGTHLAPGAPAAPPGFLDILDQTKLPGEVVRLRLSSPEAVYRAIRTLAVRHGDRQTVIEAAGGMGEAWGRHGAGGMGTEGMGTGKL